MGEIPDGWAICLISLTSGNSRRAPRHGLQPPGPPAVEKLFGVGPARARQLMTSLPGIRAGNAAAAALREVGSCKKLACTASMP